MKQINRWSFLGVVISMTTGLGLMASTGVFAQDSRELVLEEIIVTARKHAENLQDLGLSVSVLSKSDIEKRFDIDLQTIQNAAPNVVISDIQQGPGSPAAMSIRGVGTTDIEKNFDPTVGVVVDGVFIGVNSGAMIKAIDLESVEILRGPQGTLFGRNSIGGIINVARVRPDFNGTSGSVRVGAGDHGDMQIDAFVNLTASDQFAFRVGAAKRENDGWFYNATLNRDAGAMEYTVISPSFTWKPTEDVEIYYRFDKAEQDQDANTLQSVTTPGQVFCYYYDQCSPALGVPQSGQDYVVLQNDDPPYPSYFDSDTHVLNVTWKINDNYDMVYVMGDFSTDEQVYQDWDGSALTLYHTDRPATWDQQSHEVRLNYVGDKFKYTAGLYYWDSDYHIDLTNYIGFFDFFLGLPAGTVGTVVTNQSVTQTTESTAIFFEGDYQVSDQVTLTFGGRYTEDDKTSGVVDVAIPELLVKGGPDNPFAASWSEFTPKLGIRYQVNDDVMLYGLYSKGFRAGGFNGRPGTYEGAATAYNPETVDNIEFGIKSEWLDGRLRFNVSIFTMAYEDKQEEQSVPTAAGTGQQTLVLNASEATINGLEIDFNWLATDTFALRGNLGLLDAEFDTLIHPATGTDLSYLKLRRAPDMTGTIEPVWTFNAGGGVVTARASLHYVDDIEYTFLNTPQAHSPSNSVIDASITYSKENMSISLWGLNLNEDNSWSQGYDVGTDIGFEGLWTYVAIRPPRSYGVVFAYNF